MGTGSAGFLDQFISFVFVNFGLTMFVFAAGLMLFHRYITHGRISEYEIIFRWLILLPVGVTGVYTFVMHAFFPEMAADLIGWANSPFQYEVAVADLSFGVLAILSFNTSRGFRVATVIGNSIWLWGDAVGHLHQMLVSEDYAVGNAGSWFWLDILLPVLLIVCIYKIREQE